MFIQVEAQYLAAWKSRVELCHRILQQPAVSFRLGTLRLKRVFKVKVDAIQVVNLGKLNLLLHPDLPVGGVEQLLLGEVGDESHFYPVLVSCLY